MYAVMQKDAASAILYSAEKATWMAGEAIQALGGNGYIRISHNTGVFGVMLNYSEIGAVTSEIRRMLIGRELFNETDKSKINVKIVTKYDQNAE